MESLAFDRFDSHEALEDELGFELAASIAERFTAMMCFACDPAVYKCSSALLVQGE
jgi:hypothetical protein